MNSSGKKLMQSQDRKFLNFGLFLFYIFNEEQQRLS